VASEAPIVALVKPQFEVGKGRVGKGGIVRDAALHDEAVNGVIEAASALGYACEGRVSSPIEGTHGNKEFFVLLRPSG
jgi:23S rRNA (cytidine1920-2'-O)/16S rRNA (cytidine1409-2'-O)-methyltransferase